MKNNIFIFGIKIVKNKDGILKAKREVVNNKMPTEFITSSMRAYLEDLEEKYRFEN